MEREILEKVAHSALGDVRRKVGKRAEDHLSPRMAEAYQLTGGYVDWLRENCDLLEGIDFDSYHLGRCADLGEFTANLRARPSRNKDDVNDTKEMPTRLTGQFVRLAACLAVVLGKREVDEEVMRRVRKVAMNTAKGITGLMCYWLHKEGEAGLGYESVAHCINKGNDATRSMLKFLRSIGVTELFVPVNPETGKKERERWRLTENLRGLYDEIVVNWGK
jgi:hypothetical protein